MRIATLQEAGFVVQSAANDITNAMMMKGVSDQGSWVNFFFSNSLVDLKYIYVNIAVTAMQEDVNFIASTLGHELSHGCLATTDAAKTMSGCVHARVRANKAAGLDFATADRTLKTYSGDATKSPNSAYASENFLYYSPGNYATAGLPGFNDVAAAYAAI